MKKFALVIVLLLIAVIGTWWPLRPTPAALPERTAAIESTKAQPRPPGPSLTPTARAATFAPIAAPAANAEPAAAEKPAPKPALADVLLPGNRIYDPLLGLTMTFPSDWTAREAMLRWGVNNGENTVFFRAPPGNAATPSMYYRRYTDGPPFDMTNPEATLRDMARQKEESRSGGGKNDYRNDPDSFVFRTINGQPTLSYFATFTVGGQVRAEHFVRILGPTGYVMFFNQGPAKDVQALIPTIIDTAGTVKPP